MTTIATDPAYPLPLGEDDLGAAKVLDLDSADSSYAPQMGMNKLETMATQIAAAYAQNDDLRSGEQIKAEVIADRSVAVAKALIVALNAG